MSKLDLEAALAKAQRASHILQAVVEFKPHKGKLAVGSVYRLDKDAQADLFDLKARSPLAKTFKLVGNIFKDLEELQEAVAAVDGWQNEKDRAGNDEAAGLGEPEAEATTESWPIAKPSPKKKKTAGSGPQAAEQTVGIAKPVAKVRAFTVRNWQEWCWQEAPTLLTIYTYIISWLRCLPSLALNSALFVGLLGATLVANNSEAVGEYIGQSLAEIPSLMGSWGAGLLRGLRRSRTNSCLCPPCPIIRPDPSGAGNWTTYEPVAVPPTTPPIDLIAASVGAALVTLLGARLVGGPAAVQPAAHW